jgi:hypothetical protein
MEKEFVPYELAVKLKALGFDEPCFARWVEKSERDGGGIVLGIWNDEDTEYKVESLTKAPLYQQAFRWFRDEHDMVCLVFNDDGDIEHGNLRYNWQVRTLIYSFNDVVYENENDMMGVDDLNVGDYNYKIYEEAELGGLKRLIENVELEMKKNSTKGVLIKVGKHFKYFNVELSEEDALLNNLDKVIGIDGELEGDYVDWLQEHIYEEIEVLVYTCKDGNQLALPKELIGERKSMVHRVNDILMVTESLYDYECIGTMHGFKTKLTHVSIYKEDQVIDEEDQVIDEDDPVYEDDGYYEDKPHEYICTIISDEDFGNGSVVNISYETIQEQISKGNVYTILDMDSDTVVDGRLITGHKMRNGVFTYGDLEMTTLPMFDLASHDLRLDVRRVKNLSGNKDVLLAKLTELYDKSIFIEGYV